MKSFPLGLIVVISAFACASIARAQLTTVFQLTGVLPNNDSVEELPAGSPVLRATFQDLAASDNTSVRLTLEAVGGFAGAKVSDWSFNLGTSGIVSPKINGLTFGALSWPGASVAKDVTGSNISFKADGDGHFDFKFSFASSGAGVFGAGDSFSLYLSHSDGLTAADFRFPSDGISVKTWYSAAHIRSLPSGDSVWAGANTYTSAIPEPTSVAFGLTLSTLLGVSWFRRYRAA